MALTQRCSAMVFLALQLALLAYVNVAIEQCDSEPVQPGAPAATAEQAEGDVLLRRLRQELARERELRRRLEEAQPPPAAPDEQPHAPAAPAAPLSADDEDDGGDDAAAEEAAAEGLPPLADALEFDDGTGRNKYDKSHPMRRFHRPLLVRFKNYNTTNPVRTPYGGEATRTWFQRHGYVETDSNDWDVLWCGKGQFLNFAAQGLDLPRPWQSHNHCLGAGLLAGNKHSFIMHHNLMRHRFPEEFTHVPETFDLPIEHAALMKRMAEQPEELWILKPSTGARGEGIRIVWGNMEKHGLEPVPRQGRNTVQRYIERPYLIEGRKLHLRLYVVLRDVDPVSTASFKRLGRVFTPMALCCSCASSCSRTAWRSSLPSCTRTTCGSARTCRCT